MAKLKIGTTEYTLTDVKSSSPALKLVKDGSTFYGYLTTVKPSTPTLKVGTKYLSQPKVYFEITLSVNINVIDNTVYSTYLSQTNVYSATWSFSGSARQDWEDWVENSTNHGEVYGGSTKIYDIGHGHEEDTGWKPVSGSGTLKSDSETLANVSQRMRLDGVGESDYHTVTPRTYLTGTLKITGYKFP